MKKKEKERLEEIRYLLKDSELHFSEDYKSNHSEEAALEEEMWELEGKEDLASLDNLIEEKQIKKEQKMKTIKTHKKCEACGKILSNCVAIRSTYKGIKRLYYCSNICFGGNLEFYIKLGLAEFVEIKFSEF